MLLVPAVTICSGMDSSLFPSKRQNDGIWNASGWKHSGIIDVSSVGGGGGGEKQRQLKKVLLNVNIQNSLGPIHVVMSSENTVKDLMKAAIGIYVKEKRRPLLESYDPTCYEMHYSQFSLQSLNADEKLMELGCRNFFLFPKPRNAINPVSSKEVRTVANHPPL